MERLNMLFNRMAAALLLAGLLLPMRSFAGPIEDARALLAAGKPAEVDAVLGKLLDRRPVASDALVVSFQAAVADGRPYTAERRIAALLEKGGEADPKLIYQAAVVAGQVGKASLRRERLLYFLRQEKGWNAEVEAALLALCLDGGDADHYARYLASAPATEANLDLGLRMLAQMRAAKRVPDYAKQLNVLLSKYTGAGERNRVLIDASDMLNENVAGLQAALFEVLGRYPLHDDPVFLDML
ncbi:MAG: hypothetical protein GX571_02175, partial [Lentisphaerae bacterium]|nr:hypothetical protein [Lentisphaerota bacterium]